MTVGGGQSISDGAHFLVREQRVPRLSNPKTALSLQTLCEIPNIISERESDHLVKAINSRDWYPEGYDRRHRVQRYSSLEVDEDNRSGAKADADGGTEIIEELFGRIFDRIVANYSRPHENNDNGEGPILHRPLEVVVIEHTMSSCRSAVKTFEQNDLCPCQRHTRRLQDPQNSSQPRHCNCYIAELTILNNAIQSIEKPAVRELECWDIASPAGNHETEVVMEQNGVVVKMGESLWDWRGRISDIQGTPKGGNVANLTANSDYASNESLGNGMGSLNMDVIKKKKPWSVPKSNKRCLVIAFRGIRLPEVVAPPKDLKLNVSQEVVPSLPLSELLTIIVTTSPIRSNPSTELLERTFDTFSYAGNEFAYQCRKVIVCDGCRIIDDDHEEKKDELNSHKVTRKYSNPKQTLRNGIATTDQAKNYSQFKCHLRKLCEGASAPTDDNNAFQNTEVVELDERHGYGFALRHALYHCVATPYVCVIQHDRTFLRPTPVSEVVAAMENNRGIIKYVGMSMRSNLMYHDVFSGKYGRRAVEEYKGMILHPKELCIGGNMYGYDGRSVRNMVAPKNEKRRQVLEALKETYRGSHQFLTYDERIKESEQVEGFHQLSLSPTLFWYDNTHIVQTAHYRDFIFNPQYKMVARGGFVEDKLSPILVRSCERLGLKDGHAKFGCYLLDDHSGTAFTGHLDGGSYKTADLHYPPKIDT
ncbi:hypothetical protein ACHAWF_006735 [Thalassiosira exigua]